MFLLEPAHPSCPRQNPESSKMVVCVCVLSFTIPSLCESSMQDSSSFNFTPHPSHQSHLRATWCHFYSSSVQTSMLHGSETWPLRKENEVELQRAEIRMVRWMCGMKLQDRIPSKGLKERLGLDDIISVL